MTEMTADWSPSPELEEAALALATAEGAWRAAADTLQQVRTRCESARDTVRRADSGQPVAAAEKSEAQRILREVAPRLKDLEKAHATALAEYRRADSRWNSFLPQAPRRPAVASIPSGMPPVMSGMPVIPSGA